jgi:hypothetical protein
MIWVIICRKGNLQKLQKCDREALLQSADRPLLMKDSHLEPEP